MSDQAMHRYVVPVNDRWNLLYVGAILHVATRYEDCVEIWALSEKLPPGAPRREFRIFGTGHSVDPDAAYRGSAVTPSGALVWHLFERLP